jgi:hypothetical protein
VKGEEGGRMRVRGREVTSGGLSMRREEKSKDAGGV